MRLNEQLKYRQVATVTLIIMVSLILAACGTTQPTSYSIGYLQMFETKFLDGLKEGMLELGYEEGENVTYFVEELPSFDALDQTVQNLVNVNVDVMFSHTTESAQAIHRATAGTNMPAVIVLLSDPVENGLVQSTVHPGGNVTGVEVSGVQLRQWEWLFKVAPNLERVYFPYNPDVTLGADDLAAARHAASRLGFELVAREVRSEQEAMAAAENIPANVDAIFLGSGPLVNQIQEQWNEAALAHKLPLTGASIQIEQGTLFNFSYSQFEMGKQAAQLVDQILKGADPADLPLEQAEYFLTLNLQAAEAIGLDISDEVLDDARTIIGESN